MKKIQVFLFFLLFLSLSLFGVTDFDKFTFAKKNYITAIFKNDKDKEIEYLKELISFGKKSNQDVSKYQSELYRIDSKNNLSKLKIENKTEQFKFERYKNDNLLDDIPEGFLKDKDNFLKSKIDYSIKSIYAKEDSIIIEFAKQVSKDDIKFLKQKKDNGQKYSFEIKGNFKNPETTNLSINGISKIELSQETGNLLHLSLFDEVDLETYYYISNKNLVIRNRITHQTKSEKINPEEQNNILLINRDIQPPSSFDGVANTLNIKSKTIVIDAGHGGKDSGAIGPDGEYEKIVTFKIAKYLYKKLKELGYTPYLTRDNDSYIPLKERTRIANRKNADLFISVHANAAVKERMMNARGIETYFLSPARSDRAKGVAALENKEDMDAMESFNDQDLVLTLLNRTKTVQSQKLAIDVQRNILYQVRKKYGKEMIDNGVREAPFWVLVGAQMPAVLVEVGYISHPEESKILISETYQEEVANGIAEGITAYFIHNR